MIRRDIGGVNPQLPDGLSVMSIFFEVYIS